MSETVSGFGAGGGATTGASGALLFDPEAAEGVDRVGVFFAAEDATAGFELEERGDRVAIQRMYEEERGGRVIRKEVKKTEN